MKSIAAIITAFLENRGSRSNLRTLVRLLCILFAMIALYSIIFHLLMAREGHDHSWITGVYWTLTVMSTLGFGDITFHSDLGRFFSIIVMASGVMFLLVILPFTFIEFFYAPWMKAQAASRAPRQLPESTQNHVILTAHDAVAAALIPMLVKHEHPYILLVPTVAEALELYETGIKVGVGDLDDPLTYRHMRLRHAAALVASRSDVLNTNITFTARELAENVPIIATATSETARDVLELAGATLVLRLEEKMAEALARRVIGPGGAAHQIGDACGLPVAEALVSGTPLEGKTIRESAIRKRTGLNVIGIWHRGALRSVTPDYRLEKSSVLLLAGTTGQIEAYNAAFSSHPHQPRKILIIGGGKVGRILHANLSAAGLSPVIIERDASRVASIPDAVIGDTTDIEVLKAADARSAGTVIITSHDDDLNISLAIFFRRLREEFHIISRCTLEKNVRTLHRAGADLVLSSAAMGANTIYNMIRSDDHLVLAEGISIFPHDVPPSLTGKTIAESEIRRHTACTIIALETKNERVVNPDPQMRIPAEARLLLVGTLEAEDKFLAKFPAHPRR